MNCSSSYHSYKSTGAFSDWVTDYLSDEPALRPFYTHRPDWKGIEDAMAIRKKYPTDRQILVQTFSEQYKNLSATDAVQKNIALLGQENCFTICTAHQPHIFLGPLYLVYKIIHAIKLAEELSQRHPNCRFVPVYFMGSEDADLKELGSIHVSDKSYQWETPQKGAVGRMRVDALLLQMLDEISLSLSQEPFGAEIISHLKDCFVLNESIEKATFHLIHRLFGKYGLLVLLPDQAVYKASFTSIIQQELEHLFSHHCVQEMVSSMPEKYKITATGRELNLFYLKDDLRERIIRTEEGYQINQTDLFFSKEAMKNEWQQHPERFSPNVVLRPLFQEKLLPNVAFVGGGSELTYWMQLKSVFEKANVPYPPLILRNSFILLQEESIKLLNKFGLSTTDIFFNEHQIIKGWLSGKYGSEISIQHEIKQVEDIYTEILKKAKNADVTLENHLLALRQKATKKLKQLEQKMLRAEKRKHENILRGIQKIKAETHPGNILQERTDTFFSWYARLGSVLIDKIYEHSKAVDQEFCVLEIKN